MMSCFKILRLKQLVIMFIRCSSRSSILIMVEANILRGFVKSRVHS